MRPVFLVAIALLLAAVVGQRRVCEPGSVFRVACNTCRCNGYGTDMACTRRFCPEPARTRRFCEPGSFFRRDCKDCRCNDDGTNAACTLKACLS